MTPPRALQVCPNDHPPFLDVCRNHAAALARAGMAVDTVFLGVPRGERWDEATYLGVERGTGRMAAELRRFIAGREYRLVVAHRYRSHQVVTRGKRTGATIVTIAHEFGMFARWRRRWRRRLFASDVYCAGVSQAVADEMHRYGVAPSRTLVLPNPADGARLEAARLPRDVARERLGIRADEHVVAVIGRLHRKKRPQLALEGFAGMVGEPHLAFVGDGELRAALESQAKQLGVASRVHFTGRVADAARFVTAFDAVVVASTSAEAFGMTLLEAMLAGVPVVCADVPGPSSVLGPGGLYFSGEAPALTAALSRYAALSEGERARLCEMQRKRAEELFSIDALAGRYRALLSTDAVRRSAAS